MNKEHLIIITRGYPANAEELSFLVQEMEITKKYYDILIIPKYIIEERDITDCNYPIIPCVNNFNILQKFMYLLLTLFDNRIWKECIIFIRNKRFNFNAFRNIISEGYFSKHLDIILNKALSRIPNNEKVVLYSYWHDYGLLSLTKIKRKNTITITRIHGFDLYNERCEWGHQCFKEQLEKKLDRVIFISNYGMQYYLENFLTKKSDYEKFVVNYLGVTKQHFVPYSKQEKFHLISCANLVPLKRVDKIVESLSKMDEFDIEWTHIGGGPQLIEVKKQAQKLLDNKKNIEYHFTDNMDNKEVLNLYSNKYFDCFILLSETEGLPVSIMEAMSFGIPVIANNVGGINEIVTNNNGCLLHSYEDVDSISNAILSMFKLPMEQKQQMRENAYNTWKSRFDAYGNAEKLVRIINNI